MTLSTPVKARDPDLSVDTDPTKVENLLKITAYDDFAVVRIKSGVMEHPHTRDAATAMLKDLAGKANIILDLSRVGHVEKEFFSALIPIHLRQRANMRLKLTNVGSQVANKLSQTNLKTVFDVHPTEGHAIASINKSKATASASETIALYAYLNAKAENRDADLPTLAAPTAERKEDYDFRPGHRRVLSHSFHSGVIEVNFETSRFPEESFRRAALGREFKIIGLAANQPVVINFEGVTKFGADSRDSLMALRNRLNERGVPLLLVNVPKSLVNSLRIAKFLDRMDIYGSTKEALAAIKT